MPGRDRHHDRRQGARPIHSCAALVEQRDWKGHPLGPPEDWPVPLRSALSIMLGSGRPTLMCWGEAKSALYNDAFAALLGARHPGVFGAPVSEVWGDVWSSLAPLAARLFSEEGGASDQAPARDDEQIVALRGNAGASPRHLAIAYMPLHGSDGQLSGMLCPCVDVTGLIRAQEEEQSRATFMRLALDSGSIGLWQANVTRKTMTLDEESQRLLGLEGEGEEIPLTTLDRCVHPDDVDALKSARDRSAKEGRFEWEYRIRPPNGPERWIHGVGEIRWDEAGRPVVGYGINLDVTERRQAEEALRASEAQFRTITEAMPQIVFSATPDGTLDFLNTRWREFTGAPESEAFGDGWAAFFHPDDVGEIARRRDHSVKTGEWFQAEGRLAHHRDGRRWVLARALPVHDAEGRITRWLGTLTDIEEIKQSQAQRKLLSEELGHRLKNVIALVHALALRTFDGKDVPRALTQAFEGRLAALGSAHDLLLAADWRAAPLRRIVEDALLACGGGAERSSILGPEVILPPKAAVSLALALHELSTNAAKYGALSVPGGHVRVEWKTDGGRLAVTWTETGGPPAARPEHQGFGTKMIEKVLAADLRGKVSLEFGEKGLTCRIDAPLPEA